MDTTYLNFGATDGYPIAATLFQPHRPIAAVLISGATGAPQRYYAPFARYLAGRGFLVMTYDYRGMGGSAWPGLGKPDALRMRHWGERDLAGALQLLADRYPQLPKLAVGHSVGGQLLGLAGNNHLVAAQLGIAAQNGHWRNWPVRSRPLMAAIWNLYIPAVVRVYGRLPAAAMGPELPSGVAREWARWCASPDFVVDDHGRPLRQHFEGFRGLMRFVAIADDHGYGPTTAVAALQAFYANAHSELHVLRPQDYGLRAMGHFGFFRPDMPARLWQDAADWLRRAAQPALKLAA